jgi:hypothetical protein
MRLLADVDDRIDAHTFPATAEELIAEYGEIELDLQNGEETFGEALGRLGDTSFESADDVRTAAYSAVSKGAIGRQNYSDRDSPAIGETGPDPLSF